MSFKCLYVFQEQGKGQNGAECGAFKRGQNNLPFYLSRGMQDQTVMKAGYCVKQGAVVSTYKHGGQMSVKIMGYGLEDSFQLTLWF